MIYVSKIGQTQRYALSPISEAGSVAARVASSAACDACRKIAKQTYPTLHTWESVRCYHVAVRDALRAKRPSEARHS